jgi:hypothetical protein
VRALIVVLTAGAALGFDSEWWLPAAVAALLLLVVTGWHAHHRGSVYRQGWG